MGSRLSREVAKVLEANPGAVPPALAVSIHTLAAKLIDSEPVLYAGHAQLCAYLGCANVETARTRRRRLAEVGWLVPIERVSNPGRGHLTRWRFVIPTELAKAVHETVHGEPLYGAKAVHHARESGSPRTTEDYKEDKRRTRAGARSTGNGHGCGHHFGDGRSAVVDLAQTVDGDPGRYCQVCKDWPSELNGHTEAEPGADTAAAPLEVLTIGREVTP